MRCACGAVWEDEFLAHYIETERQKDIPRALEEVGNRMKLDIRAPPAMFNYIDMLMQGDNTFSIGIFNLKIIARTSLHETGFTFTCVGDNDYWSPHCPETSFPREENYPGPYFCALNGEECDPLNCPLPATQSELLQDILSRPHVKKE